MTETLHFRMKHRWAWAAWYLVLGVGLDAFAIYMSEFAQGKDGKSLNIILTICSVVITTVAIYAFIDFLRHWVEAGTDSITVQGVFLQTQLRWEEVNEAVWGFAPPGIVTLKGASRSLTINFRNYNREESARLIDLIRSSLPDSVHKDERFVSQAGEDGNAILRGRSKETQLSDVEHENARPAVGVLNDVIYPKPLTRRDIWTIACLPIVLPVVFSIWFSPLFLSGGQDGYYVFLTIFAVMLALGVLFAIPLAHRLLVRKYHRLELHGDRIISHGRSSSTVFQQSDLRKAVWHGGRNASIALMSDQTGIAIDFTLYEREDQLRLIRYFRNDLPRSIQYDWPHFCHKYAIPLSSAGNQAALVTPTPAADEILNTRRRVDRLFAMLLCLFIMFCTVLHQFGVFRGAITLFGVLWFISWPLVFFWYSQRRRVPPNGQIEKRLRMTAEGKLIASTLGLLFCAPILPPLHALLKRLIPALAVVLGAISLAAATITVFWWWYRRSKEDQTQSTQARERAEAESAAEWERLEQVEAAAISGVIDGQPAN